MEEVSLTLVLACDFADDSARAIGPESILRLQRGLEYQMEASTRLVTAASWWPDQPQQPELMSVMMARWLMERTDEDVLILEATSFDTRGELRALYSQEAEDYTVITSCWHLPRSWLIARQVCREKAAITTFVAAPTQASVRTILMELPKWVMTSLPERHHEKAKATWRRLLGRTEY